MSERVTRLGEARIRKKAARARSLFPDSRFAETGDTFAHDDE